MRLGSELIVDLKQLATNYECLKQLAKNEVIFMVKANAYGHGLKEITSFAFNELGIKRFGCASVGEAAEIRRTYPKMKCDLWVFSDLSLHNEQAKELYLDYNIVPVLHSLGDLKIVLTDSDYKHLPLVLKFDTGMHRLGIDTEEVEEVIKLLKTNGRNSIYHLMTHFANSYKRLKENDRTHRQYNKFLKVKQELQSAGISIEETSCANSGAIEQNCSLEESHIRPGLMLYGPDCGLKNSTWAGKPISTLSTEVLKTVPVKRGTPVGYGSHVVGKDGHIVYLPMGYGDGILTYYSGKKFIQNGEEAQVLGRVNMDLTALFFEKLPPGVEAGTNLEIWGPDRDMSDLAARLTTSSYQIFTAISDRIPRRYLK